MLFNFRAILFSARKIPVWPLGQAISASGFLDHVHGIPFGPALGLHVGDEMGQVSVMKRLPQALLL